MAALVVVAAMLAGLQLVSPHSYHQGRCPYVPPMADFDVGRFQGLWYALEKTSTSVHCLTNKYTASRLEQTMLLGVPGVNHVVKYHGQLSVPDPGQPASMEVKFALNIAGRSSYVIVDTDYDNYALVYSCQKIALWYRHSATILSRRKSLEPETIRRLHQRLDQVGVSSRGLDRIPQTCSSYPDDGIELNIRNNVFRPTNVTEVLTAARDFANEAVDVAKDAAVVYNSVSNIFGDRRKRDLEGHNLDEENSPAEWRKRDLEGHDLEEGNSLAERRKRDLEGHDLDEENSPVESRKRDLEGHDLEEENSLAERRKRDLEGHDLDEENSPLEWRKRDLEGHDLEEENSLAERSERDLEGHGLEQNNALGDIEGHRAEEDNSLGSWDEESYETNEDMEGDETEGDEHELNFKYAELKKRNVERQLMADWIP